jgi:hypothetical protein
MMWILSLCSQNASALQATLLANIARIYNQNLNEVEFDSFLEGFYYFLIIGNSNINSDQLAFLLIQKKIRQTIITT